MKDSRGYERYGNWMQTNSGVDIWPLDSKVADIVLDDIAHSLSMTNRYGGHTKHPYSVAQHSCLIFDWFYEKPSRGGVLAQDGLEHLLRWALLHDAPEMCFGDMVGPVKRSLNTGDYKAYYAGLEHTIVLRFNLLPFFVPPDVDFADKRIVLDEQAQLMSKPSPLEWEFYRGLEPLGVKIEEWSWLRAKTEFLNRCATVGLE